MELFLTSSVHAVAHDIAKKKDLTKGNKLVFITTPVEPKKEKEDLQWLKNDRQALVDAGFEVTDYTITGKSKEQIKDDLKGFDFIYMSGGNAAYLLGQSQKSGFISLVKELVNQGGKTYIGTSAGSIMAGPTLPDYFRDDSVHLENRDCYGFVNFTLIPHWGSDNFKERYLGERLKATYRTDQVPLLILTDNQYVHITDNSLNIVDVTKN